MADGARWASAIWPSHSIGSRLEVTTVEEVQVALDDELVDIGGANWSMGWREK